jgi:rifampicin phosphotransferase
MSFAGQQETYLNVQGADQLLAAVKRCWASLWTARAIGYRTRQGVPSEKVAIAVVVQELVEADAAGILFTANPMTGARDQVLINAGWGLGEAIVGGLVTPDTFIVNKQTGAIESQEIADKVMMTARTPEGTREEPVPREKRRQAVLTDSEVVELSHLGMRIHQLYGQPVDIEWAIKGGRYSILQARPITALPQPRATLEWKLPRAGGRYMRASVIELLPDPLSPLFETLAVPAWNKAMREMAAPPALAQADWFPEGFLLTINDYAYYDIGFSPRQSVRLLPFTTRLLRELPRARQRWAGEARPRYANLVGAWASRDLRVTRATALLEGAREIVQMAAVHYLTIQSGILPMAYMSEGLFTNVYNRFIKRKGDPPALTFMLGFDSAPIQAEKSLYDLASWARAHTELADYLTRATTTEVVAAFESSSSPVADTESWRQFTRLFDEHLKRFGHASYDLDFAKGVPADDPAPLLETFKYFLSGQGRSPHDRQAKSVSERQQATQSMLARLKGLRLR